MSTLDEWMERMDREYSGAPSSGTPTAVDDGAGPETHSEEDWSTAEGIVTLSDGAVALFEVGLGETASMFTGLAGIVAHIVGYAISMGAAADLSERGLQSIVQRISTACANEFVHQHRSSGLAASAVRVQDLRNPALEGSMNAEFDNWIVCARNVGLNRRELCTRAMTESLTCTARNMTTQIGRIEAHWRQSVERAIHDAGVPSAQKPAIFPRLYDGAIAQRRVQGLEAYVQRAISQL